MISVTDADSYDLPPHMHVNFDQVCLSLLARREFSMQFVP